MTLPDDIYAVIEAHLDGEDDPATWQQAQAQYGDVLDEALAAAQTRRAAVAALARPPLPPALRQALIKRPQAPQTRSMSLLWGLPLLATAAVLILLWNQNRTADTQAPASDRDDQQLAILHDTPVTESDMPRVPTERHDQRTLPEEGVIIMPGHRRQAETALRDTAPAMDAEAPVDAPSASAAAPAIGDDATSPGAAASREPQEDQLMDEAIAELQREALAFREDITAPPRRIPSELRRGRRAEDRVKPTSATGVAAVMQVLTAVDGSRHLLVVLHNGSGTRLAADTLDLRLEGLDAEGQIAWSQVLPGLDETILEPDQSHSLHLQFSRDISPPMAVSALRLAVGGEQGEALELIPEDSPSDGQ